MPDEDTQGSLNNKGKRFCSKEDCKIGTLMAMFIVVVFNSLLILIVPMHIWSKNRIIMAPSGATIQ